MGRLSELSRAELLEKVREKTWRRGEEAWVPVGLSLTVNNQMEGLRRLKKFKHGQGNLDREIRCVDERDIIRAIRNGRDVEDPPGGTLCPDPDISMTIEGTDKNGATLTVMVILYEDDSVPLLVTNFVLPS